MSIIKLNNNGVKNATAFGSITGLGSMTFIKKLTASGSSTLSFVDGASGVVLDNTYKEYLFTFNNIHPSASSNFTFQVSIDSGSNYNVAMTTTVFSAYHYENDGGTALFYNAAIDQAQGTAFQELGKASTDNDSCCGGTLNLFSPSSDTFVKHFIGNVEFVTLDASSNPYSMNHLSAGYANTTSAVDAIQFKMSSGNFDGDICLYGIA